MLRILTLGPFFLLLSFSLNAYSKTSDLERENVQQINNWYKEDLKDLDIEFDKPITTEDINEDKSSAVVHLGNRGRHFPPYFPPSHLMPAPPPYIVTCFYQNDYGWMYSGSSPYLMEADYIARTRCLQFSTFCYPRGCR